MAGAIHITEMQRQIGVAKIYRQQVNIECWEYSTGAIIKYKGWEVLNQYWKGGTTRLRNPRNGEIRSVCDILIFRFNNQEVYL
ncbi:MAG: maintenance system killer protein [Bacteroidaceae bacterium]|nr:maintenance system killer protein [Bacteroidaceae bacterium]